MRVYGTTFILAVTIGAAHAQDALQFTAQLSGAGALPPTASFVTGDASISLKGGSLTVQIVQAGPTMLGGDAFVQTATGETLFALPYSAAFKFGPDLWTAPGAVVYRGAFNLTSGQMDDLQAGRLSAAVASSTFPNGEIRGKITPVPEEWITYTLLPGSQLMDFWSGAPPVSPMPMQGTFELVQISDPVLVLCHITNINFTTGSDSAVPLTIVTGNGMWESENRIGQSQDVFLNLDISNRRPFKNPDRRITQTWPIINFTLEQESSWMGGWPIQSVFHDVSLTIVAAPVVRFTSILPDRGTGKVQLTWQRTTFPVVLESAPSPTGPFSTVATNLTANGFVDSNGPTNRTEHYYRLRLQ